MILIILQVSGVRLFSKCECTRSGNVIFSFIHETGSTANNNYSKTVKGPVISVTLIKEGGGLGFSLEGGKDSPFGDLPLTIKKIFTGKHSIGLGFAVFVYLRISSNRCIFCRRLCGQKWQAVCRR